MKDLLDKAGVPTKGQALVHVLLAATLEGLVVRGPVVSAEHAFVDPVHWLGRAPAPLDRRNSGATVRTPITPEALSIFSIGAGSAPVNE